MKRELAVMNAATANLHVATLWSQFHTSLTITEHMIELSIFGEDKKEPLEMIWEELETIVLAKARKEITYYPKGNFYALNICWEHFK